MYRLAVFLALLCGAIGACASTGEGDAVARGNALTRAKKEGARLLAVGDTAAAVAKLESLARVASADPQVFVLLGRAYAGLGRDSDAVKVLEQAIRLRYESAEAHLTLGTQLMREGRTGRARTELELALRFAPNDPLVHYNYGVAMNRLGHHAVARHHWRIAWRLAPGQARFAAAVGIGLTGSSPRRALAAFAAAESLGASGPVFANNYGLALLADGRADSAAARFAIAVAESPESETYRFNRAGALMQAGRFVDATDEWKEMERRFGRRWSYSVYCARALVERKRYEDAANLLKPVVLKADRAVRARHAPVFDRSPPTLDEAFDILALAERGRGNKDAALGYARRAVELAPTVPERLINYGVILAENGMLARAREQWRRVLQIDPKNPVARKNLSASTP